MHPTITKTQAFNLLTHQRDHAITLKQISHGNGEFKPWWHQTRSVISNLFGEESPKAKEFNAIGYTARLRISMTGQPDPSNSSRQQKAYLNGLASAEAFLDARIAEVKTFWPDDSTPPSAAPQPTANLELIFNRFHAIACQLRHRHGSSAPLEINDEYDVQYLLHSLLLLHFDDVRPEEWTPSYAGSSSRMDFLLPEHGMVVEVKKTRRSMTTKDVGDQLLIDIARYKSHPNIKTLFCFVYDPENILRNPRGIESDLSKPSDGLEVKCFIRPQ